MRRIGLLPNQELTQQFLGYLFTQKIAAQADAEGEEWAIWAHDEDHLDESRRDLAEFLENPAAEKFQNLDEQITKLVKEKARQQKQAQRAHVNVKERWERPAWQNCPVTFGLIAISVLVVVVGSSFDDFWRLCDQKEPLLSKLYIIPVFENRAKTIESLLAPPLAAVRQGEVWRLFTPMFLHFSPLHILFNMLWLKDLGMSIEMHRGKLRFLLIVLLIAACSNVAQYIMKGPFFGGMSGVVFGLFGYIWMKSKYDPSSGFFMPPNTIFLMLFYMLICYTNVLGPIANYAHTVGLVSGMAIGLSGTVMQKMTR